MSAAKPNSQWLWTAIIFFLAATAACIQPHAVAAGRSGCGQASQVKSTSARTAGTGKLTPTDVSCIRQVLLATTSAEVEWRFRACRPTASSHMAYAYMQIKFHAPHADDEVIEAIPDSLAAMRQLYSFSGTSAVAEHAYEDYYNHLFLLGKRMPQLLPTLFAVADQYGTDNPNVDEESWFCERLGELYKHDPTAYMRAVKITTQRDFRNGALYCRNGSGR